MKTIRGFLAGGVATFAVIEYFLWNGLLGGLGTTLFFLLITASYYIGVGLPVGDKRRKLEHFAMTGSAVLLSLTYVIFDSTWLGILNFLVIFLLLSIGFLQGVISDRFRWDNIVFLAETAIGNFVRPFAKIAAPFVAISSLAKVKANPDNKKIKQTIGQILLALFIGIPIIIFLSILLFMSDSVFFEIVRPIFDSLIHFRLEEVILKGIMFIFCLPFVWSVLWSYKDKFLLLDQVEHTSTPKAAPKLPVAFAITILSMINMLYLLYAIVQFRYLFGASGGVLPSGMTYAEYARSGFFELAFISFVNLLLMLTSVRTTKHAGTAGIVLRVMNFLLLALSCVQLASAFLRMQLYINVYGLSLLRYNVTAFMILIAVLFLIVLLSSFLPRLPLIKCFLLAGAVSLIVVNFSAPDYQIARYNTEKYLAGELEEFDDYYMFYDLNASGRLVIFENREALLEREPTLATRIDEIEYYADLMRDSENLTRTYKHFTVAEELLMQAVEKS